MTLRPIDLNAFTAMSDKQREAVSDHLTRHYKFYAVNNLWSKDLACGMEFVLQALGTEGYEYS